MITDLASKSTFLKIGPYQFHPILTFPGHFKPILSIETRNS
ncbi:hypothetical protein MWLf4_2192 [Limosilactobacillus fermentum]|nr:hypothetical protein MWLf4_2192 [Limosilactobacillus fermentum]